ncbi:MAG: hypothetical protein JO337_06635 [Acidimicrobiales bacterium]|nr:hypothetical protein [Acidimicrobiales bacterium]
MAVIPWAQAGLLNFENALTGQFGEAWALSDQLSVPLQLAGFRNPDIVTSLRQLQASLPLDVQAILTRAAEAAPDLLADPTYQLRVAFLPAVPTSGRNPDAVAYFVRPNEVPDELTESLQRYVVLPKVVRPPRPNLGAKDVAEIVQARIPYKFNRYQVITAARALGVRPQGDATDPSGDRRPVLRVGARSKAVLVQPALDRSSRQRAQRPRPLSGIVGPLSGLAIPQRRGL